ncbi:putative bifunctional diguanylate cyclase/phosphodiesterase [Halioxenophilus sp. WMMB6]|uniref:putative bifunctional diguanylate cyclase/phosphodiesterase n=1 Tax=Halioxenophilus sp. WMMB6 TaxID=3073815 RepID=UPI00295ECF99|nr:EAL domain-containing protein [Halioxenophilus sp. WMMB6]
MGQWSSSFLRSRLARRTFMLFVVSALVPILIFSSLATQQVDSLFYAQQRKELQRSAKNFGLLLYERISLLRKDAENRRRQLESQVSIGDFRLQDEQQPLFARVELISLSDGLRLQQLERQFPVDFVLPAAGSGEPGGLWVDVDRQPWLVSRVQHRANGYLLLLQPAHDFLWDGLSDYDLGKQFSIYNEQRQLLFQSEAEFDPELDDVDQAWPRSRWNLLLSFFTDEPVWEVEVVGPAAASLLSLTEFQQLFRLITLLAVLLGIFVSLITIRRNLQPIEALSQGIKRINDNQFGELVEIKSGDEFELLGNTFNSMSVKLGRHMEALRSLTNIDQLILNRLVIEDIVQLVLSEGRQLLEADAIHFFVAGDERLTFTVFSSRRQPVELTISDFVLASLHHPGRINSVEELRLPPELSRLVTDNAFLYSANLLKEGAVSAVLMAEYQQAPSEDLLALADSFVDHIAVALSHADWQKRLFHQANYDALTGLPNRYLFADHLTVAIEQSLKSQQKLALFFVDVDEFKSINDAFGHAAGDQLLRQIAGRLAGLGGQGRVYRVGGDEFVLLYSCTGVERQQVVIETGEVAECLRAEVMRPIQYEGKQLASSVSIGIAIYPDDSFFAEKLLKFADQAMYQAKALGRNRYQYYSEIYRSSATEHGQVVADLRQALAGDEFILLYQPKVDLLTGRMKGCEALIRWLHPKRGIISPTEFIPLVEAHGLMEDLGRWVIRTAAKQKAEWRAEGVAMGRIAINISIHQIRNVSFYKDVLAYFGEFDCRGDDFEFEVIETSYVDDFHSFKDQLIELQKLGVIFSIDDYGTGYSSLSRLLNLPIDTIKIDKSFVDNIATDPVSSAIVESTINLAKAMGLSVVAEGVETPEQLARLLQYKCDAVQGFLFSRPVSAAALASLVDTHFMDAAYSI